MLFHSSIIKNILILDLFIIINQYIIKYYIQVF